MTRFDTIADMVGRTPLIPLRRASRETGCTILGKAEFMNPGQSVKDRAALYIIDDAERRGALRPGGTVVEGTAGNTGIGLAHLCRARGYRCIIVIPETQSPEKMELLRALGWEGVAMVEYKRDVHSGEHVLMEVNGRFWGSLQLAIDAGVDFPSLLARVALGEKPAPVTRYRLGVRTRWTLGDLDHEAQAHGLATPLGVVSRTGVGGLTLHGGLGFMTRRLGLSCDNLIGAEVVTADGQIVLANRDRHSDLLWALRGGGGNFGVVTSLEYQLHPVGPDVWMFIVMYPMDEAASVFRFFREFMADASEDLMALAILWNSPHDESIPAEARNKPVALVSASNGALGGLRGLYHARWVLQTCGMIVIPQQKALSRAATAFDDAGQLVDPKERDAVYAVAQALVELAAKLAR